MSFWSGFGRTPSIDSLFKRASRVRTAADFEFQEQDHLERNQELREFYAMLWACVAISQILFTCVLLVAQGSEACPWSLEPEVMIAFLGATSLNALTVVLAISKGLFHAPK